MSWFKSLFSATDKQADSIIVAGLLGMLGFCLTAGYATYQHPDAFSAVSYGTGAAAILAGIGGGKGLRDKLTPPDGQGS